MKKKLFIVSADEIILYQPTLLNLYSFLEETFDVTIISFEPQYLGKAKEEQKNVVYIKFNSFQKGFFRICDLGFNAIAKRVNKYLFPFKRRSWCVRNYRARLLAQELKRTDGGIYIAVDAMPLYVVQQGKGSTHFLSLEIIPGDRYMKMIKLDKIFSVVIQNTARYQYLFGDAQMPTFFIQNAPMLNSQVINKGLRKDLLWAGTVVKEFGVLNCFDLIAAYPQFNLVCKGAVEEKTGAIIENKYAALISSGKVKLDSAYLPAADFVRYLSGFRIGLCFYDWELIRTNFNYATAPSGKLFMYLAAGVPVIACNISSFKFIEEGGAGVLIDDYAPATIAAAIEKIEADFENYSANAYRAFEANCFDMHATGLLDQLLKEA